MGANYKFKRKITHRLRHGRMSYATEVFGRRKVTTTAGQTSCFFCMCWFTPWATPLTLEGVAKSRRVLVISFARFCLFGSN